VCPTASLGLGRTPNTISTNSHRKTLIIRRRRKPNRNIDCVRSPFSPMSPLPIYPLTQPCQHAPLNGSAACDVHAPLEHRLDELLQHLYSTATLQERANLLRSNAPGVQKLNLPPYSWWNEALHGVAGSGPLSAASLPLRFESCLSYPDKCATSFPAAITTASAFNTTLIRSIGSAIGDEARAFSNYNMTGLTFWTPNVNIFRGATPRRSNPSNPHHLVSVRPDTLFDPALRTDPRWGRGQETPGEDPTVNADYAEHFVRGFQTGEQDPSRLKASACCKHFVAYSVERYNASIDRHSFNAIVSPRDLEDTYLPAFAACVSRGNASALMCSYNAVNGVPSCADKALLTATVRQKWGLSGYITSDCGAVSDVEQHHRYTHTPADTISAVLDAGTDLDCGNLGIFNYFGRHLPLAMRLGEVSRAQWEHAARNLLRVQMRLGMFDPDGLQPFRRIGKEVVNSAAPRQLALDAARQGIVLVKNDGPVLPWAASVRARVVMIGPHANATLAMLSNYHGVPPKVVSPYEGVANIIAGAAGTVGYVKGCSISSMSTEGIPAAEQAAAEADHVVLVVGNDQSIESEGLDRTSISLPGVQAELIERVAAAAAHKVVVVVISGGPVDVSSAKANPNVGAMIVAGYPGQSGGQAIAETIYGRINPSGRLTQTWYAQDYTKQCSMLDFNMRPNATTGCPGRGYRFFNGSAVFRFGEGLSFTNFTHSATFVPAHGSRWAASSSSSYRSSSAPALLAAAELERQIEATRYRPQDAPAVGHLRVRVTNVGDWLGDEVVLCYVYPPGGGSGGEPSLVLRRYARVRSLVSGAAAQVELDLTAHDFTTTDDSGQIRTIRGMWRVGTPRLRTPINVHIH
jgi:beta-D-xylosidase 4